MNSTNADIVIVGGGIVGVCVAYQLLERKLFANIVLLEKEDKIGFHSSGRNSGVLHAGLYYKPDSLKANVCVAGSKRLKRWIDQRSLPISKCGKIIVPQDPSLDGQLDLIAKRGRQNGAKLEILDQKQLQELIPEARSSTGRALWTPDTSVVIPKLIMSKLREELEINGVRIFTGQKNWRPKPFDKQLIMQDGSVISYGHLINCAGLQADRLAHQYGVGLEYSLLPFKGLYWQLKKDSPIKIRTNLYPVPDLDLPFLGVHFTPSADKVPTISIGPTATPAWGRENYKGFKDFEFGVALRSLDILAKQYVLNRGHFRNYVHQQALLSLAPFLLKSAKKLIPKLTLNDIEISQKVGIRSQLFNGNTQSLEDDFLCLPGPSSTHVLNSISPAFTASFALADLIISKAGFTKISR